MKFNRISAGNLLSNKYIIGIGGERVALPGAATSPRASQGLRDDRVGGAGAVSQGGNILPKIQEDNKKVF